MCSYKERKLRIQGRPYFRNYNDASIAALRKMTVVDGWSLSYALQHFAGGHKNFSEERKVNQKLADLYKEINESKIKKKAFYKNTRY